MASAPKRDSEMMEEATYGAGVKRIKFNQKSLFNVPIYSDLTIVCGVHTWTVHRSILANYCDFFRASCNEKFKAEPVMYLNEDHPKALETLLRHLYGEDVAQGIKEFPYEAYILADKYMARSLMEDTIKYLSSSNRTQDLKAFVDLCVRVFQDEEHSVCNGPVKKALVRAATSDFRKLRSMTAFEREMPRCPELCVAVLCDSTTAHLMYPSYHPSPVSVGRLGHGPAAGAYGPIPQ